MRTVSDACESAAAVLFCAADEAALCRSCDDKLFFYCEIDGSSLCLQCNMIVHVGAKRTHERYLVLRQRIEFPGDKPGHMEDPVSQPRDPAENRRGQTQPPRLTMGENQQNHGVSPVPNSDANADGHAKIETNMIDLNMRPPRIHEQEQEQASNDQEL